MEAKIVQITAGRGPAECCWVVAQVLKHMLLDASKQKILVAVLDREKGIENGTLFSATMELKGREVKAFLSSWVGTIQWIGVSQFRKYHKRKNWFIGVNELSIDHELTFVESDLKYQAIRSGGPGGQHVNKVSTAVRVTHVPTGLTLVASDSRSQSQNKKMARQRIEQLVRTKKMEDTTSKIKADWQNHNELQRGNPVRVFEGHDFKKRTDKNENKHSRSKAKNNLKKGKYED